MGLLQSSGCLGDETFPALLQDTGLCRSLLRIEVMGSEARQVSAARV